MLLSVSPSVVPSCDHCLPIFLITLTCVPALGISVKIRELVSDLKDQKHVAMKAYYVFLNESKHVKDFMEKEFPGEVTNE